MLQIDILEGARGTGKSTLAFKLRQKTPETTLINFTGFHTDGENGLEKVSHYYRSWMKFLFLIWNHDSKFIFDRFFFSERVFSLLYKEYDFKKSYIELLDSLETLSEFGVKINVFYLTVNNEEELKQRLIRDKAPFGRAEETVAEALKQQELYSSIFESFFYNRANKNMRIYTIDTSDKTNDEVYTEILELKATN